MLDATGLSFLIPSFNPPKAEFCKLLKSLESFQSIIDFEVVVLDDSTDGFSLDSLLEEMDPLFSKTKVIYRKCERISLAEKRLRLLREVHYKYFTFLDCDDEILPTDFKKFLTLMDEKALDLLEFPILRNRNGRIEKSAPLSANEDLTSYAVRLCSTNSTNSLCSKIYAKSVIQRSEGLLNKLPRIGLGEDKALNLAFLPAVRGYLYCPHPYYVYKIYESSTSRTRQLGKRCNDTILAYQFYSLVSNSCPSLFPKQNLAWMCKQDFASLILSVSPKLSVFRPDCLKQLKRCDDELSMVCPGFWGGSKKLSLSRKAKFYLSLVREAYTLLPRKK